MNDNNDSNRGEILVVMFLLPLSLAAVLSFFALKLNLACLGVALAVGFFNAMFVSLEKFRRSRVWSGLGMILVITSPPLTVKCFMGSETRLVSILYSIQVFAVAMVWSYAIFRILKHHKSGMRQPKGACLDS
jgi:FtsH-binding integral membrane protein